MIVISVVGLQFTGSTLLFNMLRFICQKKKFKFKSFLVREENDIKISDDYDYIIIKCHKFFEKLQEKSNIIFLPQRDIRDSIITLMKRRQLPFEKAIEHYKNTSLSYYYEWKKYENFQFSYEIYMKNKSKYTKYILNTIKIKLNDQELKELLNNCEKLKENLIKINGKFEKSNYNIFIFF